MNIQIRISIRAADQYDDDTIAEIIEKIIVFVRALFPDTNSARMDSPVIVTIHREEKVP